MADLYRLIGALVLLLVSTAAAALQPVTDPAWSLDGINFSTSKPAACATANYAQQWPGASASYVSVSGLLCRYSVTYPNNPVEFQHLQLQVGSKVTCPSNSTETSPGVCTCASNYIEENGQCNLKPGCPAGQHEEGGACVPNSCKANETRVNGVCVPEPACPAGETRVNGVCQKSNCKTGAVAGYYDMTSTTTASTCSHDGAGTYCTMVVEWTMTAPWPEGARYYGVGRLTGSSCGPAPDGPGSPTPTDPPKPSDPNAPKPTQPATPGAPAGGSPGQTRPGSSPGTDGNCPPDSYKSNGSCYPKNPPPEAPDSDGKCPVGTIKVGSVCAVLQPAPDKEPGEEEKKPSVFSGACNAVACEGDAIQCAIVREQYRMNCKLFDNDSDSSSLTNRALNGSDSDSAAAIKGRAEQVSVSSFDQSGFGWSRSCPADPSFEVAGESFDIPFSKVCGVLGVLSNGALGLTLLGCLMWVVGRKD